MHPNHYTRSEILLFAVSAIVGIAPLCLPWLPWGLTEPNTYTLSCLAVMPAPFMWISARASQKRKWLHYLVKGVWWFCVVVVAIAAGISTSDPWAPLIWITASEIWLGASVVLLITAGTLHSFK